MIYLINTHPAFNIVEWATEREIELYESSVEVHCFLTESAIKKIKKEDIVIGDLSEEMLEQINKVQCSFLQLDVFKCEKLNPELAFYFEEGKLTANVKKGKVYGRDYETLPEFSFKKTEESYHPFDHCIKKNNVEVSNDLFH